MIYISENAPIEVSEYLTGKGYEVTQVRSGSASGAVSAHPDIYMCRLGGKLLKAIPGEIGAEYPENAAFCAAVIGSYFVHNLKITSKRLLDTAVCAGLKPVHVNQGYTKCSCAIVDSRSVITADRGVARVLRMREGIDVLEISAGGIRLPGHPYGFIGGASGRVGDEMIFCGDITEHRDHKAIRDFITARGVRMKWFDFPLLDVGTIIEA